MRTLWLVRHATPLIAPGTCYGSLDVAADAAHTATAADALNLALPAGAMLVSSPLRRCRQLATALSHRRPTVPMRHDPRLAEMHFGSWEGRTWQDIGMPALDAWTADFADHAPGGGETVQGFIERVASAMDDVPEGDTAWITHAGVVRATALIVAGRRKVTSAGEWPSRAIAFGSWLRLSLPELNRPA